MAGRRRCCGVSAGGYPEVSLPSMRVRLGSGVGAGGLRACVVWRNAVLAKPLPQALDPGFQHPDGGDRLNKHHLVTAARHEFVPFRWGRLALDLGQQPHDLPRTARGSAREEHRTEESRLLAGVEDAAKLAWVRLDEDLGAAPIPPRGVTRAGGGCCPRHAGMERQRSRWSSGSSSLRMNAARSR